MEINTCEQYVLSELKNLQSKTEVLEDRVSDLLSELNTKTDDYVKLLNKYSSLSKEYEEITNLLRNTFKTSILEFNDSIYFQVIPDSIIMPQEDGYKTLLKLLGGK